MSRMMKMGTGTLRVILWFASILIWFSIFVPIEYLVNYFSGETTNYILHSDDFMMPIKTHVASTNAIASFPSGLYTTLMIIGYILMLVGVFITIQAVSAIVRHIQ
ncbi:integral membrane protein [Lactiplantibacillus plantarum]|nr:integral membrane protein [Lactiplantibacillus plantarum]